MLGAGSGAVVSEDRFGQRYVAGVKWIVAWNERFRTRAGLSGVSQGR